MVLGEERIRQKMATTKHFKDFLSISNKARSRKGVHHMRVPGCNIFHYIVITSMERAKTFARHSLNHALFQVRCSSMKYAGPKLDHNILETHQIYIFHLYL
jgi:hypothetical protein